MYTKMNLKKKKGLRAAVLAGSVLVGSVASVGILPASASMGCYGLYDHSHGFGQSYHDYRYSYYSSGWKAVWKQTAWGGTTSWHTYSCGGV